MRQSHPHLLWQIGLLGQLSQLGLFQRLEIRKRHNVSNHQIGPMSNTVNTGGGEDVRRGVTGNCLHPPIKTKHGLARPLPLFRDAFL